MNGNRNEKVNTETQPIYVTRTALPPFEEYEALIRRLWDTRFITNMGEYHEELKEKLRDYLGTGGVELFVNGHMALEMLLQAEEIRGEVITTPFTFASTVHAVTRNGLKAVMCDVRETDGTMDPDEIRKHITKETGAILPVHVYGRICDDEAIGAIAKEYGLRVIYDAAHTFGETVLKNGRWVSASTLGDASMLSFHATKAFHSIEGGAVVWDPEKQPELGKTLGDIKNFGITGKESVDYIGGNAKLNEFCAAMGICNLRHIDAWIDERRRVAERYTENLKGLSWIRLPESRSDVRSNYAYFPVVFDPSAVRRDAVYETLCAAGIYPRKYFYPLAVDYACYRGYFDPASVPAARAFSDNVLTLPIYPELSCADVDRICEILTKTPKIR